MYAQLLSMNICRDCIDGMSNISYSYQLCMYVCMYVFIYVSIYLGRMFSNCKRAGFPANYPHFANKSVQHPEILSTALEH